MCTESSTASRGIAIINKQLYQLKGSDMVDACGVTLVVSFYSIIYITHSHSYTLILYKQSYCIYYILHGGIACGWWPGHYLSLYPVVLF